MYSQTSRIGAITEKPKGTAEKVDDSGAKLKRPPFIHRAGDGKLKRLLSQRLCRPDRG